MTKEFLRAAIVDTTETGECFRLMGPPGPFALIQIVNMNANAFRRVSAEYLTDGFVEVDRLATTVAVVVDGRVPAHEIDRDLCPMHCPPQLFSDRQLRAHLVAWTPSFDANGRITQWRLDIGQLRQPGGGELEQLYARVRSAPVE